MARRLREAHGDMKLSDFKALVRDQFFMLVIDQDEALKAIPAMLPEDREIRQQAFDLIRQVLAARGGLSADDEGRLAEVARLFGAAAEADSSHQESPGKPRVLRAS
jgi:hypothetical protein